MDLVVARGDLAGRGGAVVAISSEVPCRGGGVGLVTIEPRLLRNDACGWLSVDAPEETSHGRDVLGRAAEEDVGRAALDDDVLVRESIPHELEGRGDVALARVVREALGGGRRLDWSSLFVRL